MTRTVTRNRAGCKKRQERQTRKTHQALRGASAWLVALLAMAGAALAGGTQFWTLATYDDFFGGELKGISLGRDGSLTVAPQMDEVFQTDQAMIWAAARDARGNLYLGTGHSGKVYRLGPDVKGDLKGEMIYDAQEPDIFALAVDRDNRVYIGASPDGKIYRLESNGEAREFFDPQSKYIWSMSFASDGALFVGTGDRGRIFRVAPDGTGAVYYETNQTHVMTLALLPGNELIAGTEPNGLLYKITSSAAGAGRAFVIYDSPLAEIHQVSLAPDGSIYAAALGSSAASRQRQALPPPAAPGPQVIASTSITVRAADEPNQLPAPDGQQDQPPGEAGAGPGGGAAAPRIAAPAQRGPGGGGQNRSAVVRIWPDGSTQTLWESTSENAFDLIPSPGRLLFSTDENGRIYQLQGEHDLTLLTQTEQEQTTRLIPHGDALLATTANLGKVFKVSRQPASSGTYEAAVKDAGNIAGWGQIRWKAQRPAGTAVELYTRSGNSAKPDATWSEWSAAYSNNGGQQIASPAARYLQWKALLRPAAGQPSVAPVLQEVTVAYLPRNRAPEITELKTTPRPGNSGAGQFGGGGGVGNSGRAGQRAFPGAAAAGQSSAQRGVDVSWLASDPDQDELTYVLYFRGEAETEWKVLEEEMKQNYFQLGPEVLPDGSYRLRVVATDASGNPAEAARSDERISAPFVVDFTAPQIEVLGAERRGNGATVRWKASDAASFLTRADYALDGGPLTPLNASDGLVDSNTETFTIQLDSVDGREHLVSFRVIDFAGNVGTGKAVLPAATGAGGSGSPARGNAPR